ncbi:NUDIX domain-containing protein [Oscillochloris sp. ZM17-4]|uniref:nucleotide triphosphate diphosphatase NUDT15 n=1 Tax=Oscillochloris sp. ZM17-4 TaxID=2866714 RepID=UPI001C72B984|nr:NUDIX hydrolase [Oscillochloris sp. ZM17-4]MBX0330510.1 NUDIX domain-containing protein [Oscillochloris sp. ZM17-4]
MDQPQRPAVGVSVIIRNGDKILLGWRVASHGANSWQLPGGHLEYGETPEGCGAREVREETGLTVVNLRRGPYTNDIFADEGKHYITLFVEADYAGGEPLPLEPTKCARWEWFRWDDLPEPQFLPLANLMRLGYIPPESTDRNY